MLNQNADTFTVKDFTLGDGVVMPRRCCWIILASGSSPPLLGIHTAVTWLFNGASATHNGCTRSSLSPADLKEAVTQQLWRHWKQFFPILRLRMEDIITAGNLCSKPFATTVQRLSATMV